MTILSKEALLARRSETTTGFPEDLVEVASLGGEVRVRGLSRHEVVHVQSLKGAAKIEQVTISLALLEPAMTEAEVAKWQKVSDWRELDRVTHTVMRLSGMLPEQRKEAYKEFEEDPGSEFRILPSAEAVDDGGTASGADE